MSDEPTPPPAPPPSDTPTPEIAGTVGKIITKQNNIAKDIAAQAREFLERLVELASQKFDVTVENSDISMYDNANSIFANIIKSRPIREKLNSNFEFTPQAPTVTEYRIKDVEIPEFNESPPPFELPQKPTSTLPNAPAVSGAITSIDIPQAPRIDIPAPPTLSDLEIPPPPAMEIPLFTAEEPIDDLVAPSNNFTFNEAAYTSVLHDALFAKLLNDTLNGGYGIEPTDEALLYQRAIDREVSNADKTAQSIRRSHAALGYRVPPGAMFGALNAAQQAAQTAISTLGRDLTIKRADMFVQNRQFVITQGAAYEGILRNYFNSLNERGLNAGKAVLDAGIAVFNAQVERYNARLRGYDTKATVFGKRIDGALAVATLYEKQIQGLMGRVELQKAKMEQYRALLEGIHMAVEIYSQQMQGAAIKAGIEKTKLDSERVLIDMYLGQVQGKEAEYRMYGEAIRGETSKLEGYKLKVETYRSKVDAKKVVAEIEEHKARAHAEYMHSQIELYNSNVRGFEAKLQHAVAKVNSQTDEFRSDVSAYEAEVRAAAEAFRLLQSEQTNTTHATVEIARLRLENARLELHRIQAQANLNMHAADSGSRIISSNLSGAWSSINTLATVNENYEHS